MVIGITFASGGAARWYLREIRLVVIPYAYVSRL